MRLLTTLSQMTTTTHPSTPLTTAEAFSGILGSISLAAWIFLLVPQLIENHTNGHADGISMTFLFIWAAGDILSLAGGLWAGLVPTVIALAIYFCFADGALITQCIYYNTLNAQKDKEQEEAHATTQSHEQDPLLASASANTTSTTQRKPSTTSRRSHRRSSAALSARRDSLSRALSKPTPTSAWLKNSLSILAIVAAGTVGWALAYKTGAWRPVPLKEDPTPTPLGASLLGYGSALLYLGARVPQIVKNQRERSCDGLSLLFFLLSLLGNATYGAGILCHSLESEYVWTNLPWLIGSLGTMVEDLVIFAQFRAFGEGEDGARVEGEAVV
ncbi:hypothetical protein Q7P35_006692 [Cladosporium inversicolor]